MSEAPFVTVLVPARNEQTDIERCLQAVLDQDHPHDRMEVIVVDGGSSDTTAAIAGRVLEEGDVTGRVLANPVGTTPSNLNAGLAAASGDVVCRVDARSLIPPSYVRTCAQLLLARSDVVVTGGAQVAVAADGSVSSRGIARALNNRFTMGGARYRSSRSSGPTDTVYLGAFRTADLRAVGGWDERMLTNQDFELNRRLGRRGVVWFDASLAVEYVPRRTLRALGQQYLRFGEWKVEYWRSSGDRPRPRQIVSLVVPLAVVSLIAATVAGSQRRLRDAVTGGAGGAAGMVLLDHLGAREAASAAVRAMACVASVTLGTAWVAGVARGLLRRPQSREDAPDPVL